MRMMTVRRAPVCLIAGLWLAAALPLVGDAASTGKSADSVRGEFAFAGTEQ
jgi:hypothetical protein